MSTNTASTRAQTRTGAVAEVVIDSVKTALTAVAAVGEATNIGPMKGVAGLGIQIITITQTIRSNQADARGLAIFVANCIQDVHSACGQRAHIASVLDDNIETLNRALAEVHGIVEKISRRKLVRRFFKHEKDKRRIEEAKVSLQNAVRRFTLVNDIVTAQGVREIGTVVHRVEADTSQARADTAQLAGMVLHMTTGVQRLDGRILAVDAAVRRIAASQVQTTETGVIGAVVGIRDGIVLQRAANAHYPQGLQTFHKSDLTDRCVLQSSSARPRFFF